MPLLPWLICACVTCLYVACLYLPDILLGLARSAFPTSLRAFGVGGPRNSAWVILKRSLGVAAAAAVSWLPLAVLAATARRIDEPPLSVRHLLGLRLDGLGPAVAYPLLLTAILYAGPLCSYAVAPARPPPRRQAAAWAAAVVDPCKWRDLALAPLAEEFVFRACLLPAMALCGVSRAAAVAGCPLFFGAAHLHHVAERMLHGGAGLPAALAAVFAQAAYTSAFGVFAAHLFSQSGRLAAPVAAHVFCNWMGVPDFGFGRHGGGWRWRAVAGAYGAGVVGFVALLGPLTSPRRFSNDAAA